MADELTLEELAMLNSNEQPILYAASNRQLMDAEIVVLLCRVIARERLKTRRLTALVAKQQQQLVRAAEMIQLATPVAYRTVSTDQFLADMQTMCADADGSAALTEWERMRSLVAKQRALLSEHFGLLGGTNCHGGGCDCLQNRTERVQTDPDGIAAFAEWERLRQSKTNLEAHYLAKVAILADENTALHARIAELEAELRNAEE